MRQNLFPSLICNLAGEGIIATGERLWADMLRGFPHVHVDCACGCVLLILVSLVMPASTQSTNSKAGISVHHSHHSPVCWMCDCVKWFV